MVLGVPSPASASPSGCLDAMAAAEPAGPRVPDAPPKGRADWIGLRTQIQKRNGGVRSEFKHLPAKTRNTPTVARSDSFSGTRNGHLWSVPSVGQRVPIVPASWGFLRKHNNFEVTHRPPRPDDLVTHHPSHPSPKTEGEGGTRKTSLLRTNTL